MIPALFILGIFFTFAVFCGLLIYGYRSRAHSAEARANRAEGALEVSQHNLNVMAEITRECVKDIGLNPKHVVPDEVLPPSEPRGLSGTPLKDWASLMNETGCEIDQNRDELRAALRPDYIPKTVAFCPNCSVSVRHDPNEYPVPCPACKTLIDPVLDNPPEFS